MENKTFLKLKESCSILTVGTKLKKHFSQERASHHVVIQLTAD
jgi:hypothetical protein